MSVSNPSNDNNEISETTVTVEDLAKALNIDEDELLERIARTLIKREITNQ